MFKHLNSCHTTCCVPPTYTSTLLHFFATHLTGMDTVAATFTSGYVTKVENTYWDIIANRFKLYLKWLHTIASIVSMSRAFQIYHSSILCLDDITIKGTLMNIGHSSINVIELIQKFVTFYQHFKLILKLFLYC